MNELIDLHVHLPGTVRASTLADLAAANGVDLPLPAEQLYTRVNSDPNDEEKGRGPWFPLLRVYEMITASLRTRDDFARVIFEALEDESRDSNVCYAELAFSPVGPHEGRRGLSGDGCGHRGGSRTCPRRAGRRRARVGGG